MSALQPADKLTMLEDVFRVENDVVFVNQGWSTRDKDFGFISTWALVGHCKFAGFLLADVLTILGSRAPSDHDLEGTLRDRSIIIKVENCELSICPRYGELAVQ